MSDRLFPADSMMRRINRESILLLGGRAALLLQLAHPLVAAGVYDHSGFPKGATTRLRRTLDAMLSIVFGDEDTARRTVERVNRVHEHVVGTAPGGELYSALDPHLMLWVHATLVDTSLRVYEGCVERLDDAERMRYYDDTKVVGELFGIPSERIPVTLGDLRAWMEEMVSSGEVVVTPAARELAAPILKTAPFVPLRLARGFALVEAGLLPPAIREGYGLKLGRSRAALLAVGGGASRRVWKRLPRGMRSWSPARAAERRTG